MQRKFFSAHRSVYYLKRISSGRFFCLLVKPAIRVFLTIPYFSPMWKVEVFLRQKSFWIFEKRKYFKKKSPKFFYDSSDYKNKKHQSEKLIRPLVEKYCKVYGFCYNRLVIKNHKTRWGSCSQKRNLNFNYRLIFLPSQLLEYVVVHELCHLRELNHSPKFWFEVGKILPNYRQLRRQLQEFSVH